MAIYEVRTAHFQNNDADVKTGVAAIELHNGDVVAIGDKTDGVYSLTTPTADSTRLGVVWNADVALTDGKFRGLTDDPREVKFAAGTSVNFYIPHKEDEVAFWADAIPGAGVATNKVIVPATTAGDYVAKAAAEAADKLVYKITGTSYVSIGSSRVKMVEAVCVLA